MWTPKMPIADPAWLFVPSYDGVRKLERERHEMMMACLSGGMSYDNARFACETEYDKKIVEAKEAYHSEYTEWKRKQFNHAAPKPKLKWGFF